MRSLIEPPPQPRVGPRQLRLRKAHRFSHLLRDLLVRESLDIVQPDDRTGRFRQPLEGALEVDVRADVHPWFAVFIVHRFRLADRVAPYPHQRLGRRDLPAPAPEIALAAVLLEAANDLE